MSDSLQDATRLLQEFLQYLGNPAKTATVPSEEATVPVQELVPELEPVVSAQPQAANPADWDPFVIGCDNGSAKSPLLAHCEHEHLEADAAAGLCPKPHLGKPQLTIEIPEPVFFAESVCETTCEVDWLGGVSESKQSDPEVTTFGTCLKPNEFTQFVVDCGKQDGSELAQKPCEPWVALIVSSVLNCTMHQYNWESVYQTYVEEEDVDSIKYGVANSSATTGTYVSKQAAFLKHLLNNLAILDACGWKYAIHVLYWFMNDRWVGTWVYAARSIAWFACLAKSNLRFDRPDAKVSRSDFAYIIHAKRTKTATVPVVYLELETFSQLLAHREVVAWMDHWAADVWVTCKADKGLKDFSDFFGFRTKTGGWGVRAVVAGGSVAAQTRAWLMAEYMDMEFSCRKTPVLCPGSDVDVFMPCTLSNEVVQWAAQCRYGVPKSYTVLTEDARVANRAVYMRFPGKQADKVVTIISPNSVRPIQLIERCSALDAIALLQTFATTVDIQAAVYRERSELVGVFSIGALHAWMTMETRVTAPMTDNEKIVRGVLRGFTFPYEDADIKSSLDIMSTYEPPLHAKEALYKRVRRDLEDNVHVLPDSVFQAQSLPMVRVSFNITGDFGEVLDPQVMQTADGEFVTVHSKLQSANKTIIRPWLSAWSLKSSSACVSAGYGRPFASKSIEGTLSCDSHSRLMEKICTVTENLYANLKLLNVPFEMAGMMALDEWKRFETAGTTYMPVIYSNDTSALLSRDALLIGVGSTYDFGRGKRGVRIGMKSVPLLSDSFVEIRPVMLKDAATIRYENPAMDAITAWRSHAYEITEHTSPLCLCCIAKEYVVVTLCVHGFYECTYGKLCPIVTKVFV